MKGNWHSTCSSSSVDGKEIEVSTRNRAVERLSDYRSNNYTISVEIMLKIFGGLYIYIYSQLFDKSYLINKIMKKSFNVYEQPQCQVTEIMLQEIIAGSTETTSTVSDYYSGYSSEVDF